MVSHFTKKKMKRQKKETCPMQELFTVAAKYEEYLRIRADAMYTLREASVRVSAEEMAALEEQMRVRGLDDDQVYASLVERQRALEEKGVFEMYKVQESMLQLYRVLTRRKVALFNGQRMPPLDSIFSK